MTKKVLILSFSKLDKDPRVRREIFFLKDTYQVTAAGFTNPNIEGVEFIEVGHQKSKIKLLFSLLRKVIRRYEWYYWGQKEVVETMPRLEQKTFDVVIANDIDSVPMALKLFGKTSKIIFDAHEYSPMEHSSFFWNLLFKGYNNYLVKTYAHKCQAMLTVCEGIAELYKLNYGLSPTVITNAANFESIPFQPRTEGDKIMIIHHGIVHPSRKIDNMIRMMDFVDDRFELHLMLVHSKRKYYDELIELSKTRKNVKIIPPVPLHEIIEFSAAYSIGLYILEPTSLNNSLALPNKFFEFVQSRLALAIGPSPEMARLVKAHKLGIVAADFDYKTLAAELNKLTVEKINEFRSNTDKAAKALSSETNKKILNDLIGQLLA